MGKPTEHDVHSTSIALRLKKDGEVVANGNSPRDRVDVLELGDLDGRIACPFDENRRGAFHCRAAKTLGALSMNAHGTTNLWVQQYNQHTCQTSARKTYAMLLKPCYY